jgi:hypothetical protein
MNRSLGLTAQTGFLVARGAVQRHFVRDEDLEQLNESWVSQHISAVYGGNQRVVSVCAAVFQLASGIEQGKTSGSPSPNARVMTSTLGGFGGRELRFRGDMRGVKASHGDWVLVSADVRSGSGFSGCRGYAAVRRVASGRQRLCLMLTGPTPLAPRPVGFVTAGWDGRDASRCVRVPSVRRSQSTTIVRRSGFAFPAFERTVVRKRGGYSRWQHGRTIRDRQL